MPDKPLEEAQIDRLYADDESMLNIMKLTTSQKPPIGGFFFACLSSHDMITCESPFGYCEQDNKTERLHALTPAQKVLAPSSC